MCDG